MERLLRHVAQRVNFDQGISLSVGFLTLRHDACPLMVISGDRNVLMAFGAMVMIALVARRNLDILLQDKQHFGETAMQISHTARGLAMHNRAEAAGVVKAGECRPVAEEDDLVKPWGEGGTADVLGVFPYRPVEGLQAPWPQQCRAWFRQ
jgi:hypothetical protein